MFSGITVTAAGLLFNDTKSSYNNLLKMACLIFTLSTLSLQGCEQVGKALNLPPLAVLGGYLIIGSFILSPASVKVPNTDWEEPVLLWITICMPTGSGKSQHLYELLQRIHTRAGFTDDDTSWIMDDTSFEKNGSIDAGKLFTITWVL